MFPNPELRLLKEGGGGGTRGRGFSAKGGGPDWAALLSAAATMLSRSEVRSVTKDLTFRLKEVQRSIRS